MSLQQNVYKYVANPPGLTNSGVSFAYIKGGFNPHSPTTNLLKQILGLTRVYHSTKNPTHNLTFPLGQYQSRRPKTRAGIYLETEHESGKWTDTPQSWGRKVDVVEVQQCGVPEVVNVHFTRLTSQELSIIYTRQDHLAMAGSNDVPQHKIAFSIFLNSYNLNCQELPPK